MSLKENSVEIEYVSTFLVSLLSVTICNLMNSGGVEIDTELGDEVIAEDLEAVSKWPDIVEGLELARLISEPIAGDGVDIAGED